MQRRCAVGRRCVHRRLFWINARTAVASSILAAWTSGGSPAANANCQQPTPTNARMIPRLIARLCLAFQFHRHPIRVVEPQESFVRNHRSGYRRASAFPSPPSSQNRPLEGRCDGYWAFPRRDKFQTEFGFRRAKPDSSGFLVRDKRSAEELLVVFRRMVQIRNMQHHMIRRDGFKQRVVLGKPEGGIMVLARPPGTRSNCSRSPSGSASHSERARAPS